MTPQKADVLVATLWHAIPFRRPFHCVSRNSTTGGTGHSSRGGEAL